MPATIFTCYKEEPDAHAKKVIDSLIFESDTLEGDELITMLATLTEDYLAQKIIDDEDAYYEDYPYALDEYTFETIAEMLDDEEEKEYTDFLCENDIEYVGHEEVMSVSVCADDDLIVDEGGIEEARKFLLENADD